MFRKIVSRLSFSPTLIRELGNYSHQLRRHQQMRRIGIVIMIIAIAVQYMTLLLPIQPLPVYSDFSDNIITVSKEVTHTQLFAQIITELPPVSTLVSLIISHTLLFFMIYMYLRTLQLSHEVKLIRKEATAGTI